MNYESNPAGMRELGTSSVMTKAAMQAADQVTSAANTADPKGRYSAKAISTFAGHANEPRNAAVVEGSWWPGAASAALLKAAKSVAAAHKGKQKG